MATIEKILLPDVGDFKDIEIIEILIHVGDEISKDDSIIILESDKATMEIPSPLSGKVTAIHVSVGDRISQGAEIASVEVSEEASMAEADELQSSDPEDTGTAETEASPAAGSVAETESMPTPPPAQDAPRPAPVLENTSSPAHATPSIRRFARELGVDIAHVTGSGNKGRILKEDVQSYVKQALSGGAVAAPASGSGLQASDAPVIDFSKFGEIESQPLSRIKKISGAHLHRSWVSVPHVTQFDEADITELEAFRKSLAKEAEKKGVRLTPLVFIMKAMVSALQAFPDFNASLDASGDNLILKKYFHIGVAVDTPNGLVVPVIRDVDKKGIYELSAELAETAARAREGKLSPAEMQGGCISISSLGGIGGTQFTPIVNAPEVAILGVARAKMQPVYQPDGTFKPALILPLALSYDHRVIDGAQGARFTTYLSQLIADIRRVLL